VTRHGKANHLRTQGGPPARRVVLPALAAALGWALGAPSTTGVAAAGNPSQGVSVIAVVVAADYQHSHAVYAVAQLPHCQTACAELLRSRDGGGTWAKAGAKGWQPGGLASVPFRGGAALVAWWANTVAMSLDGGETFTQYPTAGSPSSAAADGTGIDVVVGNGSAIHVLTLPAARDRSVPGAPDLDHTIVSVTTAYPTPPAGVPAAIALGIDHATNTARMERCDATLACTSPIPVSTGGAIVSSPAFARDLTFFFLGAHGLERSTDGGRTLTPVTVVAPGPQTVLTITTGLGMTQDFDATAQRGTVYAGIISVSKDGKGGQVTGGVYRSADAGVTWTRFGAATDFPGGVSALALAPDGRVFAGAYALGAGASGGIFCAASGSFSAGCPAYPSAAMGGGAGGAARSLAGSTAGAGGDVAGAAAATSTASTSTTPAPTPFDASAGVASSGRRVTGVALGVAAVLAAAAAALAVVRRLRSRRRAPME